MIPFTGSFVINGIVKGNVDILSARRLQHFLGKIQAMHLRVAERSKARAGPTYPSGSTRSVS